MLFRSAAIAAGQARAEMPFDPAEVSCTIIELAADYPDVLNPDALLFLEGLAMGVVSVADEDQFTLQAAHFACLGDPEMSLAEALKRGATPATAEPMTKEEQLADVREALADLDARREGYLSIIQSLETIIELQ